MKITLSTTAFFLSFLAATSAQSLRGRTLAVAEEDKQSANGWTNSGGRAGGNGNGGGNGNWKGKKRGREGGRVSLVGCSVCFPFRLSYCIYLALPPSLPSFPSRGRRGEAEHERPDQQRRPSGGQWQWWRQRQLER